MPYLAFPESSEDPIRRSENAIKPTAVPINPLEVIIKSSEDAVNALEDFIKPSEDLVKLYEDASNNSFDLPSGFHRLRNAFSKFLSKSAALRRKKRFYPLDNLLKRDYDLQNNIIKRAYKIKCPHFRKGISI